MTPDRIKRKLAAEKLVRQLDSIKSTSLQRLRRAVNVAENKANVAENKSTELENEVNATQSRIKDLERSLKLSDKRWFH